MPQEYLLTIRAENKLNKSKIIISKNFCNTTSKALAKLFNIKISKSFGKYLEFPITNTKPKPSDYQFILDNMTKRLASWKSNFLNRRVELLWLPSL